MLEGVRLMVLGMGIVFSFLVLLVFVMRGMSRLAAALTPSPDIAPTPTAVSSAPGEPDQAVVAAITAAVERFRRDHRKAP